MVNYGKCATVHSASISQACEKEQERDESAGCTPALFACLDRGELRSVLRVRSWVNLGDPGVQHAPHRAVTLLAVTLGEVDQQRDLLTLHHVRADRGGQLVRPEAL